MKQHKIQKYKLVGFCQGGHQWLHRDLGQVFHSPAILDRDPGSYGDSHQQLSVKMFTDL